jgi:hypothetical protein
LLPVATFTKPANRETLCDLSEGISGTATDLGTVRSGVGAVSISLRRASDGKFWNGAEWSATPSMIGADYNADTSTWNVDAEDLPNGAELTDGVYNIYVYVFDNVGRFFATQRNITIDSTVCAPEENPEFTPLSVTGTDPSE